MNIKTLVACLSGLCLMASAVNAGPLKKGVIGTVNANNGAITINSEELRLSNSVSVTTDRGSSLDTDDLAAKQHVRYTLDRFGMVSSIEVSETRNAQERGAHSGNGSNH